MQGLLLATILFVGYFFSEVSSAQSIDSKPAAPSKGIDLGLALAMPSLPLSVQRIFSDSLTLAVVLGNGFQFQLNFTGTSPSGGYYFVGIGRDYTVGLVRGGYGYKWQHKRLSYHLEVGLNVPVWDRELEGLAAIGKIVYLFPIGFGVHYRF